MKLIPKFSRNLSDLLEHLHTDYFEGAQYKSTIVAIRTFMIAQPFIMQTLHFMIALSFIY